MLYENKIQSVKRVFEWPPADRNFKLQIVGAVTDRPYKICDFNFEIMYEAV
jgi:hypothetical protein